MLFEQRYVNNIVIHSHFQDTLGLFVTMLAPTGALAAMMPQVILDFLSAKGTGLKYSH